MGDDDMGLIESLEEVWSIDFDDLEFGEQLGEGAFGSVHRGNYFGTEVAIKRLFEDDTNDTELFIQREINVLQGMRHPNIVQFIGLARHPEHGLHIVTELVKAGDLRKLIKNQSNKLPWSQRAAIAHSAACAMAYLHSRNIIHRDLKSKNLLVDESNRIKICDFGFARTATKGARPMTLCGTDDWMAPEIILGYPYSMAADVFSFGIVLCELITRKKISQELQRSPMDAFGLNIDKFRSVIPPDCPDEFAITAVECCAHEPEERPSFPQLVKRLKILIKDMTDLEKAAKDNAVSSAGGESVAQFKAFSDRMKAARTGAAPATAAKPSTTTTTAAATKTPTTTATATKPAATTSTPATTTSNGAKTTTTPATTTSNGAKTTTVTNLASATTKTAAQRWGSGATTTATPTTTPAAKTTTVTSPAAAKPAATTSTPTTSAPAASSSSSSGGFTFAQLKASPLPAGVDRSDLPRFLTEDEFKKHFGMSKTEYYSMPKWKQDTKKRSIGLF